MSSIYTAAYDVADVAVSIDKARNRKTAVYISILLSPIYMRFEKFSKNNKNQN